MLHQPRYFKFVLEFFVVSAIWCIEFGFWRCWRPILCTCTWLEWPKTSSNNTSNTILPTSIQPTIIFFNDDDDNTMQQVKNQQMKNNFWCICKFGAFMCFCINIVILLSSTKIKEIKRSLAFARVHARECNKMSFAIDLHNLYTDTVMFYCTRETTTKQLNSRREKEFLWYLIACDSLNGMKKSQGNGLPFRHLCFMYICLPVDVSVFVYAMHTVQINACFRINNNNNNAYQALHTHTHLYIVWTLWSIGISHQ